MKQSKKYLLILIAALAALITLAVGSARSTLPSPEKLTFKSDEKIYIAEDLSEFNSVKASGAWQLDITRGDGWSVEMPNLESLEDKVAVYVEDGTLFLTQRESGWFDSESFNLTAKVQMPTLASLVMSGAADATLSDFNGESLNLVTSGAAEVDGRNGGFDELSLVTTGASEINLKEMIFKEASVVTTGAADITLTMDGGEISGNIIGASSVDYYGTVSDESFLIIGAGDVNHRD